MKYLIAILALLGAMAAPPAASAQGPSHYGIDVRDVDIADAARLLGDATGYSIVLDGNVPRQKITMRFTADTPEKAVNIFARSEGLLVMRVDNALILIRNTDAAARNPGSLQTQSFVIHNGSALEISTALRQALPNASISAIDRDHLVLVRGTKSDIEAATTSIAMLDSNANGAGVHTLSVSAKGRPSDIAKVAVASLLPAPGESIAANDQANQLTITGGDGFVSRAAQFIQSYDQHGKQVEFDIRIVEYTPKNDNKNFGFLLNGISLGASSSAGTQISGTQGGYVTTFLGTRLTLNAKIDALQQRDQATIISDPTISTLNNVPGTLDATEQFPIITSNASFGAVTQTVQYQPIGLKIIITPTIGADGSVTAAVDAQYSGILGSVQGYPVIGNRHATTTRRVLPGETIVIAGLVQANDDHNVQSIPVLSSLPLIGSFFKHTSETHTKSDLLFFITPRIVGETSPGFPANTPGADAATAAKEIPGAVKP